ncbi:Thioesterase/thiol ester dehydrase-isomerase [Pseudovirgaria hyperparasitica]|uniref:Thioesterase/thiol ester dehydrase-isomerase n=1 Tax=Pseudovirgaria hyperparasitica TaxID=470096 RepID=A0A6A6W3F3_9PEZI|nr:Thioesterase/thiol ester dehydrase-isomerase [Pseudovirgaria hyperparasitica]KAF2757133.1 Thioesterase/thiol ester dehydrase-isomerase [Pseudovirgaria hyperparasitica]
MTTLVKPPPIDPAKSPIENVLELTQLNDIDPNLFTNTRPLWTPKGARGIYGGAAIAQCLSAAQRTVPDDYAIHSMHCYFVMAGNAEIPVIYHVERVRDGRSFITRTVQARQRAKVIFTTTMSFARNNSGGTKRVEHQSSMARVPPPKDDTDDLRSGGGPGEQGPFQSQRIDILNDDSYDPTIKRTRQWTKVAGNISKEGGHQAHLSALAYMSDSYFIGTVARVHKLWRWATGSRSDRQSTVDEMTLKKLLSLDDRVLKERAGMDESTIQRLRNGENIVKEYPMIGMMVSLDHTIYFHNPRAFRADDWLYSEMESPWAGDGRGLVFQKIFTREGVLVATCVQEGVVRLKQPNDSKI